MSEGTGMVEHGVQGRREACVSSWHDKLLRRPIGTAVCLVALAGCSNLDADGDDFCSLNPSDPSCREPDVGGWWCLDEPPQQLPPPGANPVALILPAVEWSSKRPLAGRGLTATMCGVTDFTCATSALAAPYVTVSGMLGNTPLPSPALAGIPVAEGFDGFIKFDMRMPEGTTDDNQFVPVAYYVSGTVSGTTTVGGAVLMLTRAQLRQVAQNSFPSVDVAALGTRGVIAFGVYDCDGRPVSDATVELTVQGRAPTDTIPFQLPASRIPIADPSAGARLTTGASGLAGFFNVPPGTVQLTAYRDGDTQSLRSVELGSAGGVLSIALVRPRYIQDANLEGALERAQEQLDLNQAM